MTSPYNPRSRRGAATIRNHGAQVIAKRARDQFIDNRLTEQGLRREDLTPEQLAEFQRQAMQASVARARAAKAMKRAIRIAEEEAAAEAWAAERATKDAAMQARRAAKAQRKVDAMRAAANGGAK